MPRRASHAENSNGDVTHFGGRRDIPQLLLAATRSGDLNVLVGAGASIDVGCPSWEALLRSVASALRRPHNASVERLIQAGRLLDAAQALRRYLTPQELCHALRVALGPSSRKPGPLHDAILELHPRALLTTNFDGLLDDAYASKAGQAPRTRYGLTIEPQDCLRPEGLIFKLHGDLEDPSKLVLSRNDYLGRLGSIAGSGLSSVFAHRPTLAIGYSLRDPDLQLLFQGLHSAGRGFAQTLYLVIPEQEQVELDLLNDLGSISVLQYPRDLRPRDALLPFLERLASEREKQRLVSQETPGSISLSQYLNRRARDAFHELNNRISNLGILVEPSKEPDVPLDEVRRMLQRASCDLTIALEAARDTQSDLLALYERNQPTAWHNCRGAVQRVLDPLTCTNVEANLTTSGNFTLPIGPNLYALLVKILLNNAVVACRDVAEPSIRISVQLASGDAHTLVTTVTDNGSGTVATLGSRALTANCPTRGDNALFLVLSVAEEHGGELNLSSEPGKGTSVVMRLPVDAPTQTSSPVPAQLYVVPKAAQELEVVVIDDNSALAAATSQHLKADGYAVQCFDDPHEAVASLLERDRAPDLVICDIVMPDLSGYEVAHQLKERFPALAFIFMSGYISNPSSGSESDIFMMKPVNAGALLKCVKQLTRSETT